MRLRTSQSLPCDLQRKRLIIKRRYASLFFPASVVLIFLMACGPLRTLEHAPANIVYLSIRIQNQYTTTQQVTLWASFSDAHGLFGLSGNQALTCDGVILSQGYTSVQLNRQPPGGAYHCIYTDDQGKTSPVTVHVPPGNLAITSPTSGAVVPIPGNGQPPAPEGSPTPALRALESTDTLTIDYTVPTLPADATTKLSINVECGSAAYPNACGAVSSFLLSGAQATSGSYTFPDGNDPYGSRFGNFSPGPGSIGLISDFKYSAPVAVFQSLNIEYTDNPSIPIIWVRS